MDLAIHTFRSFFILLSELFFKISSVLYELLIDISETNIFTNEVITNFSKRIYVLLGIFMLFKVTFSLINYIVNPDDFTDKQKGVGKLVPNIMITLVLIVFTPRIFAELMDIQHLITNQHLLERVILGEGYIEASDGTMGDDLALTVFGAFYYYPKAALPANAHEETQTNSEGNYVYNSMVGAFGPGSRYSAYKGIFDETSVSHPLLSLLSAVFLVLVLIQFCFDIAIRTIKFGFLQLIASIPIVSRIDPKSAKDGLFSKWLKLCSKTYLDLFIRLLALYFAIELVNIVKTSVYTVNTNVDSEMLKAFLILGALMFAKQLPKMLEDLFGFKLDGGFQLNPIKRIEKDALGGKALTTGASAGMAAVGGFALGAGTNVYARLKNGEGGWKAFKSGVAGGASGLFRSGYSGLKDNKNKPIKAIGTGVKGVVTARNKRDERIIAEDTGIAGVTRRIGVSIDSFAGVPSGAERYRKELAAYDEYLSQQDAIDKLIEGEVNKGKVNPTVNNFKWTDATGIVQNETSPLNLGVLKGEIDKLKNDPTATAAQITDAERRYNAALKQAKIDYVQSARDHDKTGSALLSNMDPNMAAQVATMIKDMDYFAKQHASYTGLKGRKLYDGTKPTGEAWDGSKGELKGLKASIKGTDDYKKAMANEELDKKNK